MIQVIQIKKLSCGINQKSEHVFGGNAPSIHSCYENTACLDCGSDSCEYKTECYEWATIFFVVEAMGMSSRTCICMFAHYAVTCEKRP